MPAEAARVASTRCTSSGTSRIWMFRPMPARYTNHACGAPILHAPTDADLPSDRGPGLVGLADGLGGADAAEEEGQDDQGDDVGEALDEGVVDPVDPQEDGQGLGPGEQQAGEGGADRGPVAEDE